MSVFTQAELEYLGGQPLGRLATVEPSGAPHVVPVGFRHLPETDTIGIGGHGVAGSKKWRNLLADGRAAFVVDDLASTDPWTPRGILIRGRAVPHETGGEFLGPGFEAAWLEIVPTHLYAWGLDAPSFATPNARAVRQH